MSIPLLDDSLVGYTEDAQLMVQTAARVLQTHGVGADVAPKVGAAVIDQLMDDFGGVYLPRGNKIRAVRRNKQIRSEFSGHNHKELAKKHKMSEVSIRSIVTQQTRELPSNSTS